MFTKFSLAPVTAPVIYKSEPHLVTEWGLRIPKCFQTELQSFLEAFLESSGCYTPFLRVDAFIHHDHLQVIEVNAELQDGWGVALNLSRASGHTLEISDAIRQNLPTVISAWSEDYIPEFKIACEEFGILGHNCSIEKIPVDNSALERLLDAGTLVPQNPLGSKMHLAKFSQAWQGLSVKTPPSYTIEDTSWEQIPENVVFKFCEKYGPESKKVRYSVIPRAQLGKGKYMRQAYLAGRAIAQEIVRSSFLPDGRATQAILMCAGCTPITGYLQAAPNDSFVINDKETSKGPLIFV